VFPISLVTPHQISIASATGERGNFARSQQQTYIQILQTYLLPKLGSFMNSPGYVVPPGKAGDDYIKVASV